MKKPALGFTLIELLVVISIIAILSAIGLIVYSSAQKSGRTAKRIGDLQAIQTALEVYYSVNKAYPSTSENWRSECDTWYNPNVIPGLTPKYLVAMPADPAMDKTNNRSCYLYASNGNDYKLMDRDIAEFSLADYQSQRNLMDPMRNGTADDGCEVTNGILAWAIYSDGWRCW